MSGAANETEAGGTTSEAVRCAAHFSSGAASRAAGERSPIFTRKTLATVMSPGLLGVGLALAKTVRRCGASRRDRGKAQFSKMIKVSELGGNGRATAPLNPAARPIAASSLAV